MEVPDSWEDAVVHDLPVWRREADEEENDGDDTSNKETALEAKYTGSGLNLPMLIVNFTHLTGGMATKDMEEGEMEDLRFQYIDDLENDILAESEELFKTGMCFHTTEDRCGRDLAMLQSDDPDSVFEVALYPSVINDIDIETIWEVISRPSEFQSLTVLKSFLEETGRDIFWKYEMCLELERLAAKEQNKKRRRDVRKEAESSSSERATIDPRTKGLSVLDSVISMIFSRYPKYKRINEKDHFQNLAEKHVLIKKLWLREFGRLPFRRPGDDEDDGSEDEDDIEAQENGDRLAVRMPSIFKGVSPTS
eukprot:GILK01009527.1.p1 GENE.GILK01009527.1~~GILK01009527.1.p1  ORF type:complete len:318 (-),score=57.26 GILK01009527.1:112-1035(-)